MRTRVKLLHPTCKVEFVISLGVSLARLVDIFHIGEEQFVCVLVIRIIALVWDYLQLLQFSFQNFDILSDRDLLTVPFWANFSTPSQRVRYSRHLKSYSA